MAFNVKEQFGSVSTAKDYEFAVVQIVEITNKDGQATNRVEVRQFVDNPNTGYQGPTKTAFVFDDEDDIQGLIDMLNEAKAKFAPAPVVKQVVNLNARKANPLPPKRGAGKAAGRKVS
jgi:hypothetical protein